MSLKLNEVLPDLQSADPKVRQQAVADVYLNYGRWLYREALALIGDKNEAKSIVGLSLSKLPDSVRKADYLVPNFLLLDVVRRCLRFRLQRSKQRAVFQSLEGAAGRGEDGEAARLDPADTRERQPDSFTDQSESVQAAWKQLSPDDQRILTLRVFEEMPQQEVADLDKVSVETVRKREKRAKERLRKLLGDDGPDLDRTSQRPGPGLS